MILNTRLFQQVIELAQSASAGDAATHRAIDRAVVEINKSRYWSYDVQTNTLRIKSTTSDKLYLVTDQHNCEARSKKCKHFIARRLLQIYYSVEPLRAIKSPAARNVSAATTHSGRGSKGNSAAANAV